MRYRQQTSDNYTFKGCTDRYGNKVKIFDNGFGPLWLYESADFDFGIVRASSWYEACETVEDEILPRASHDEIIADFPNYDDEEKTTENERACFQEAYGISGNNGYYRKPLNGENLRPLTGKDCIEHGLKLKWEFNG